VFDPGRADGERVTQHQRGNSLGGDAASKCIRKAAASPWPQSMAQSFYRQFPSLQYVCRSCLSPFAFSVRPLPRRGLDHHEACHYDLWQWYPVAVQAAKSASCQVFGDLYEPNGTALGHSPYCPEFYNQPTSNVHFPDAWRRDVCGTYDGKHPPLLVGNPKRSFIWTGSTRPYLLNGGFRHRLFRTLAEFYNALLRV
jgi:hypothetical protein